MLAAIHQRVGDAAFGNYLGKHDETQAAYWSIKTLAPSNGNVTALLQKWRDGGIDMKRIESASMDRSVNWEKVQPGRRVSDVTAAIDGDRQGRTAVAGI